MSTENEDEKPVVVIDAQPATKGRNSVIPIRRPSIIKKPSITKPVFVPTRDEDFTKALVEDKERFIDGDPLVRAVEGRTSQADIYKSIRVEIARELASMRHQRLEHERVGKDTAAISAKRIDAMTKLVGLEKELKKLNADVIDFKSEKMQVVFSMWLDIIRDIASQVMAPEQLDLFFNKMATYFDGWEQRASDRVR
jgi:hypothetical protein